LIVFYRSKINIVLVKPNIKELLWCR